MLFESGCVVRVMPIVNVVIESPEQWKALRAPNVGCSEIAALFGIHEFITGYALAARKLGKLSDTIDNDVLKRGLLLEPVARQLLAEEKQDWEQVAAGSYYYVPELRFGASPDLFVRDPWRGIGIVQIKTVAPQICASKWHNPDTSVIEPPLWVALQAMCEQYLTGADFAVVAALVIGYGLSLEVVEVPYIQPVIQQALDNLVEFWRRVDAGKLPAPDFAADRGNLARVLRQDDGSEIDLTSDGEMPAIAAQMAAAQQAKHLASATIDNCQAKILHKMGTAQRATYAGGVITAKTVNRKGFVMPPTSYRKISFKLDRDMREGA